MGLFDFLKEKKPPAIEYQLVWFELQVAPTNYRLAIMPEQPIVMGWVEKKKKRDQVILVQPDTLPELFERIVRQVSGLIKINQLMEKPTKDAHLAFTEATLTTPSLHLRIAYADESQWAGYFDDLEHLPTALQTLLIEAQALTRQVMAEQPRQIISGELAQCYLNSKNAVIQGEPPAVIVKIRVQFSGEFFVNDQAATMSELDQVLDEIKVKNGGVWYFRAFDEEEATPGCCQVTEDILAAVATRNLPIQLRSQGY